MNWHEQGNMKAAMEELIRGQEQVTRLQSMLKDMLPPEYPSGPAADLLIEVLSSFSKALSLLDLGSSAEANPPSSNGGVRRKMQSPRRVSCRGRQHPNTCRTTFLKTIEDGFTWRKYGQKNIYGAKHPRSYYRCIHKHGQGCQATRQVQRTELDDSTFAITYMGDHTCTDATTPRDQPTHHDITSGSNTAAANDRRATPPSSALGNPKQECEEEVISNHSPSTPSSSQLLKLPALSALEGSSPPMAQLMEAVSEQYCSLEMEFDPSEFKLEDMFELSHDGYNC
ncbi:transcription factor WRKY45-1-like [Musa acuminata AAA Group]|uniref:transcription factor WRKY45-1-like n=1 Tax=Musa acuminata AAA Group TaxID=214697 RepID=UPI0031E287D6